MRRPPAHWPAVFGVIVFAVALWAQPAALVGAFYDDGIYAVLAKALAEGKGYHYIHLPGAPPAVHYPFLYPAALSLLWRVWPDFPANVALFQLFDSACLGAAAWLIVRQARSWDAPKLVQYVLIPAGFLAFPLLTIVGVRFSEPLFLVLTAGAITLTDHDNVSGRQALLAGLLAGLAGLTRSIGLVVIVGLVFGLWWRGQRGAALVAGIVGALTVAPWFAWAAAHAHEVDPRIAANYGTYLTEARQAGVEGFVAGLDFRALGPPGRLAVGFQAAWLRYPLSLLLFIAAVWGGVIVGRKAPILVTVLVLYTGLVTLWPYAPDRFMWIVLPWLAALVGTGLVAAWHHGRVARAAAVILGVAMGAAYLPREVVSLRTRGFATTAERISLPSRVLAPAIQSGVPADAVVAAEGEALIYLYTGRLAVPNALFSWEGRETRAFAADTVRRWLCDSGAGYVALSGPGSDGEPVVQQFAAASPSPVSPLFRVTRGPSLYRFRCPA